MQIDQTTFYKFFSQIQKGYRSDVAYHNDLHGADVMQFSYLVLQQYGLTELAKLHDLDILSCLVAAGCHDFGHDGFTNGFHVNTMSERAIRYSD